MLSGMRPPRPAYSPSSNGNLYTSDLTAVNQRGRPISCKWQRGLQDLLTASSSHAYAMGCAIVTLLLITVLLIFYFLGEIPHSFVVSCFLLMYPGIFVSSLKFASLNIFVSVVSFASSPAGRRRPDADWGSEGEAGCGHPAVTADPGAAGAETQPDSHERGDMTSYVQKCGQRICPKCYLCFKLMADKTVDGFWKTFPLSPSMVTVWKWEYQIIHIYNV